MAKSETRARHQRDVAPSAISGVGSSLCSSGDVQHAHIVNNP